MDRHLRHHRHSQGRDPSAARRRPTPHASPREVLRGDSRRPVLLDLEALLRVRARQQPVRGPAPRRHRRSSTASGRRPSACAKWSRGIGRRCVFTVPTLYSKMLHGERRRRPRRRAASVISSRRAKRCRPRSADGWRRATGKAPISGYGTSETLCLVLYGDDDSGLLRPTPLTLVRYADDIDAATFRSASPLRLPTLALGYWRRPEAQADGFRDGWFSPGDMFIRRGGRLEFAGRTDDLLKVSGQWVSTLWIEHALAEAGGDAIDQVAAVGVDDAGRPDDHRRAGRRRRRARGPGPRSHRRRHREAAEIPAPAMGALGDRTAADRDRQAAAQPPACRARVGAVRRRDTLTAHAPERHRVTAFPRWSAVVYFAVPVATADRKRAIPPRVAAVLASRPDGRSPSSQLKQCRWR